MTEQEQRPRENNIWTKATTVFLEDFFVFATIFFKKNIPTVFYKYVDL